MHPPEQQKLPDKCAKFETFLADISAQFINLPSHRVAEKIEDGLRRMVGFMGADRSTLGEYLPDGSEFQVRYSYAVSGIEPIPPGPVDLRSYPWINKKLMRGEIVYYSSLDELPAEAKTDRESLVKLKQKSNIIVPITIEGVLCYALAIGTIRSERIWPGEIIPRLRLLGEIMANAMIRRRSEEKLRASEESFASIFENAPVAMMLLDRDRRIHQMNRKAGQVFFLTNDSSEEIRFGEAVRCIHHLDDPAGCGFGDFCRTSCALRRIVEETYETGQSRYQVEVNLTRGDGIEEHELFLLVSSVFIDRPGGRELLISIEDITKRRQAEGHSLKLREELFHVTRISSMGELAASLAHEIKQPLTAILSNARAAARFLSADHQDLNEVREALSDIADDSSRADQIIMRLRELMRKNAMKLIPIDINRTVEEVIIILKGAVEKRGGAILFYPGADLPLARADRIQIQQVILNLVLNSLAAGGRKLVISTAVIEPDTIRVKVRDDGTGIAENDLDRIFNPYLTTKEDGMGMGLAISRTIINAHGGTIQAENNSGGGATIYFLLPCAQKNKHQYANSK